MLNRRNTYIIIITKYFLSFQLTSLLFENYDLSYKDFHFHPLNSRILTHVMYAKYEVYLNFTFKTIKVYRVKLFKNDCFLF